MTLPSGGQWGQLCCCYSPAFGNKSQRQGGGCGRLLLRPDQRRADLRRPGGPGPEGAVAGGRRGAPAHPGVRCTSHPPPLSVAPVTAPFAVLSLFPCALGLRSALTRDRPLDGGGLKVVSKKEPQNSDATRWPHFPNRQSSGGHPMDFHRMGRSHLLGMRRFRDKAEERVVFVCPGVQRGEVPVHQVAAGGPRVRREAAHGAVRGVQHAPRQVRGQQPGESFWLHRSTQSYSHLGTGRQRYLTD